MCRKCSRDWSIRKVLTKLVVSRMTEGEAEFWLWNETPMPMALPSYQQLFKALINRGNPQ